MGHASDVDITEPSISDASEREKAMLSRVRYYTRLRRHVGSTDDILVRFLLESIAIEYLNFLKFCFFFYFE